MEQEPAQVSPKTQLTQAEFQFATQQYVAFAHRVTEHQKEREVWVRHSIVATFAFFGWIAVYRDNISSAFMLESLHIRAIFLVPVLFNLGGALRFYFIQRDINRLSDYLVYMERNVLCLSTDLCEAPNGRGIRDRYWHPPSVAYWLFIITATAITSVLLT